MVIISEKLENSKKRILSQREISVRVVNNRLGFIFLFLYVSLFYFKFFLFEYRQRRQKSDIPSPSYHHLEW